MAVINRLLRQQLVREAEGYLDLASALGETWQLPSAIRDRLAYRSLAVIDRLGENASLSPQIQLIKGQALRMLELYKEALQPLSPSAGEPIRKTSRPGWPWAGATSGPAESIWLSSRSKRRSIWSQACCALVWNSNLAVLLEALHRTSGRTLAVSCSSAAVALMQRLSPT